MNIDTNLVRRLIDSQFPQWSQLSVDAVTPGGWDNRTFRLGNELSVRLPSAESYAPQVGKEQKWLPFLKRKLSTTIPEVVGLGKPEHGYPFPWSVYRWIDGKELKSETCTDPTRLATSIALFIKELHTINTSNGPSPGSHNYFRGAHLQAYDADTKAYAKLLARDICTDNVMSVWNRALNTQWMSEPVWIHGDLEPSNILVLEDQLLAVIDFGNCAIGDPACDLVMAWTYLDEQTRKSFQSNLALDNDTWERGRAWALWKALFRMSGSLETRNKEFCAARNLVNNILDLD